MIDGMKVSHVEAMVRGCLAIVGRSVGKSWSCEVTLPPREVDTVRRPERRTGVAAQKRAARKLKNKKRSRK